MSRLRWDQPGCSSDSASDTSFWNLVQVWKAEHGRLQQLLSDLEMNLAKLWEQESNPSGLVEELNLLQSHLLEHFETEENLGVLLASSGEQNSHAIASVIKQSQREHELILKRLDGLKSRMSQSSCLKNRVPNQVSVLDEFNLVIDVIEQHEERELESVGWLLPTLQPSK